MKRYLWVLLGALLVLYFLLRLPYVGHLLIWDEAMNLCTVRSLVSHGQDYYSGWFWRHPPALDVVLMLVRPLAAGFAERAQVLVICVGTLNALVLFLLNRRTLGAGPALWATFFYAVMPGAAFHDVWLKQDVFAILFGLLAVHAFVRRRAPLAGLLLGLAFLGKETALFYAMAVGVLWLFRERPERRIRDLVLIGVLAGVTSGWWYLGFSTALRYFLAFVTGLPLAATDISVWTRPWYFYLKLLPLDLGWGGVALCLAGVVAIWRVRPPDAHSPTCPPACPPKPWRRRKPEGRRRIRPFVSSSVLWPLAVLVPAYLLLSVMRGKAPWFVVALYPTLATLQGVGADGLVRALRSLFERTPALGRAGPRLLAGGLAILVAWAFVWNAWGRDYEESLRQREWPIWWGSYASREAALTLNRLAREGDRVLVTPMHYWLGEKPIPCAIFVYYLGGFSVVVRPYDLSADDLVAAVKEHKLDWAMVSPDPVEAEQKLLGPLRKKYGLEPLSLQGACIYKTEGIYRE
ncbi:MAG: glycosyltransferase family 39 protein [Verrucomicrobiota bacterium]